MLQGLDVGTVTGHKRENHTDLAGVGMRAAIEFAVEDQARPETVAKVDADCVVEPMCRAKQCVRQLLRLPRRSATQLPAPFLRRSCP